MSDPAKNPIVQFAADIATDTRQFVERKIRDASAPLEKRIAELESRPPGLKYQGVWRAEVQYAPGDVISHSGSMWIAMAATKMRPSESRDWQLAVKGTR